MNTLNISVVFFSVNLANTCRGDLPFSFNNSASILKKRENICFIMYYTLYIYSKYETVGTGCPFLIYCSLVYCTVYNLIKPVPCTQFRFVIRYYKSYLCVCENCQIVLFNKWVVQIRGDRYYIFLSIYANYSSNILNYIG